MKRGHARSVRPDSDLVADPAAGEAAEAVIVVTAAEVAGAAAIAIATNSHSRRNCDLDEEAGEPAFFFFARDPRELVVIAHEYFGFAPVQPPNTNTS